MAAHNNDIAVETIELTKVFKDFWGRPKVKAVTGLSLQILRGEVLGLLGPNGSGKTTTIKLILGLLFPTRGKIRIFGHSPRHVRNKQRIGFLPEESYLYPYQNAEEALDFYGRLFQLPRKIRHQRVNELLEMVGLTHARKRPLKEYSKGMARRIGLAQALINNPDLVILDEPTTGLDPIGTREIKEIIADLKKYHKTVLLCSHLLADVEDVCDRIVILYGGRVLAMGSVAELLTQQERLQITTEKVAPPILEKVTRILQEATGQEIHIDHPHERLERFFLEVVAQAREEALPTSGAEKGKRIQGFFEQPEEVVDGSKVIEQLVQSPALTSCSDKPEPASNDQQPSSSEPDTAILEQLVHPSTATVPSSERPSPTSGASAPTTATEAAPTSPVDQEVLQKLLQPRKEDKQV